MSTAKVGCKVKVYEEKADNALLSPPGGLINKLRFQLRYQLCIKVQDVEHMLDDITAPEFIHYFTIPWAFVSPSPSLEMSVNHVSNMLISLNVEPKVREFVTPKIAQFAVDLSKRYDSSVLPSFMTVAYIFITKVDYIREAEFARIYKSIQQEGIGCSKGLNNQNVETDNEQK
ncbi:hypothetical protein CCACVL1_26029 [Corchorus capsularis]|uniref:Uncharacterized protein n=1 Tax=Corchorus capsularis TaxID=210143 RepID=A0A1R3GG55_COCAP|nr:hypothetical protein CCACVL1_26029 [Corchorus capsularis]